MTYTEFYDLAAWPFRLTPDPGFFFAVPQHEEILESFRSSRGRGKGFRVLTGEIGAGKTMLFRVMRSELQASGARVAEVVTSNVGPGELLTILAAQFGVAPPDDEASGVSASLNAFLAECQAKGQRAVAFIDEAQNLPPSSVEALYPLVDLEVNGQPGLEIFLLGQPELRKVFDPGSADEAGRRVIWNHHLRPLQEEDTRGFILHRLKAAGWRGRPAFAAEAYHLIHRQTGGLPRRIVVLCNRLLVHAQLENLEEIDGVAVRLVLEDAQREGLPIGEVIDTDVPAAEVAAFQSAEVSEGQGVADPRPRKEDTAADPPADILSAVEKAIGVPETYPEPTPADILGAVERALGLPKGAASERPAAEPAEALDEPIEAVPSFLLEDHRPSEPIVPQAREARWAPESDETRGPVEPGPESGEGATADIPAGPQIRPAASRSWFRPLPLGLAVAAGLGVLLVASPADYGPPWLDAPWDQASDCPTCSEPSDAASAPSDVAAPDVSAPDPGRSEIVQGEAPGLGELERDPTSTEASLRGTGPRGVAEAEVQEARPDDAGEPAAEVYALDGAFDRPQASLARIEGVGDDPGGRGDEASDPGLAASAGAQEDHQDEFGDPTAEVYAMDRALDQRQGSLAKVEGMEDDPGGRGDEARDAGSSRPEADLLPAPQEGGLADRDGFNEAAVVDRPAAGEVEAEPGDSVSLIRLVLTRRIVDREPSGTVKSFSAKDRQAFAFVRLKNPGPPTEVTFVWYRGKSMRSVVKTDVGTSGAWRTWSSVRLTPGSWRVDVLSPDGRLIGEQSFVVGP